MKNWQMNNPHVAHLLTLKQRSQVLRQMQRLLLTVSVLILLVLVVLLTGCATRSPVPCEPLPPISKPVPDKSPPSQSYSLEVQTWLEGLQQKLTTGQSKP